MAILKRILFIVCLLVSGSFLHAVNSDSKDGLFSGNEGAMPTGWKWNYAKPGVGSGLTGKFNFKDYPLVMRIVGPESKSIAFQSDRQPFPARPAVIRFSVWARTAEGSGKMRMFLLGDEYKWNTNKEFIVTSSWKEYTIEAEVPEKIVNKSEYWIRIDIPAGSDLLIGKVMVSVLPVGKKEVAASGDLVVNGDFSFGGWGWSRWYGGRYSSAQLPGGLRQPKFVNDTMLTDTVGMQSWMFPYQPNADYTVRVRMKNSEPDKKGIVTVFLINGVWKIVKRDFELTNQYQDYSLTGKLPNSTYNLAYVRLDVHGDKAVIDRVEVREGRHDAFASVPALQFGVKGRTLFDLGDKAPQLAVRLKQNQSPKALTLRMTVTDWTSKKIGEQEVKFDAVADQTVNVTIPNSEQRGVYNVELTATDGTMSKSRYAILRNLENARLPDNPFGGHYDPYTEQKLQYFNRYFPVKNTINRFFSPSDLAAIQDSIFQKQLADSPFHNVMRLPYIEEFSSKLPCELTPTNEAKFLALVAASVRACKGKLYGVELINEPHLWRIRSGADAGKRTMTPEKIAYLHKIAYPVIKKEDPEVMVFGPVSGLAEPEWAEQFVKAGGAQYIDAIDFHGYNHDPDFENTAAMIKTFAAIFQSSDKTLPLYNSEAYYGVRQSIVFNSDDEAGRVYFRDNELDHAAVVSSFLIHHAASGAVFCNYMPRYLLYGTMAAEEIYPLLAAGAINAGIEFLGTAGKGQEITLDQSLRCFVFPAAQGGPLATVKVIGDLCGEMMLPTGVKAFDLMGNPIDGEKIALGKTVNYLRFPAGAAIEKEMAKIAFSGLGSAFRIRITMLDHKTLCAVVGNRRAQTQDLTLKLTELPPGWMPEVREVKAIFQPHEEKVLRFPLKSAPVDLSQPMGIGFISIDREETVSRTERLALLTADYSSELNFDHVSPIMLDERFESRAFTSGLKRTDDSDLSCRFATVWNETGLKLRFQIRDDHFVAPKDLYSAWKNDSIQLYFDMNGDATKESEVGQQLRSDDLCYHVGMVNDKPGAYLAIAQGVRYIGDANATTGLDDSVKVTCERKAPDQLEYTIFLPREALYLIKFAPGTSFGFSCLINDNDGNGRKTGLTLSPKGTEPLNNAHMFRRMILIKTISEK